MTLRCLVCHLPHASLPYYGICLACSKRPEVQQYLDAPTSSEVVEVPAEGMAVTVEGVRRY